MLSWNLAKGLVWCNVDRVNLYDFLLIHFGDNVAANMCHMNLMFSQVFLFQKGI